MNLQDQVAIITGGASGIGKATAEAMAARGAQVAVVDLDEAGARDVAESIGGLAVTCDVRDADSVADMVSTVERAFGPVDILFNNAGALGGDGPLDTPPEVWQSLWELNVMAHIHSVKAVLPSMLERGRGYLIHTSSLAGYLTTPGKIVYAATKHAVVAVAEWLSVTYHDQGIRVSCLAPRAVRTPAFMAAVKNETEASAVGSLMEPEEVATLVLEAMEEERFLILTHPESQELINTKAQNVEGWLNGMRAMQRRLNAASE